MQSIFEHVPTKYALACWAILFTPFLIIIALAYFLLQAETFDHNVLTGCYVSAKAPSLEIQSGSIRIVEPENRSLSYTIENSKDGFKLSVRPAFILTPLSGGRYDFSEAIGLGYFWTLLPKRMNSRARLQSSEAYAGRIRMIAADGQEVIYSRMSLEPVCRDTNRHGEK